MSETTPLQKLLRRVGACEEARAIVERDNGLPPIIQIAAGCDMLRRELPGIAQSLRAIDHSLVAIATTLQATQPRLAPQMVELPINCGGRTTISPDYVEGDDDGE